MKAIRSVRRWAYEMFGDEHAIQFVVMATPEDLKANAEYIRLADQFAEVPGGMHSNLTPTPIFSTPVSLNSQCSFHLPLVFISLKLMIFVGSNNNNYANVEVIVDIAERAGAQAVWAGWGHASENPKLPESLSATRDGIVFIGPPATAMRDLGDKIASTLVAQSADIPCVPWSGAGLTVDYAASGKIPEDVYTKCTLTCVEDALRAAEHVGFPAMLKASEGGGGKGIRKVTSIEVPPPPFPSYSLSFRFPFPSVRTLLSPSPLRY